jgi:hypothetical protein
MNDKFMTYTGNLNLNPGAPLELIQQVALNLGISFPSDYAQFMARSNGAEGFVGKQYLQLWRIDDLALLNKGYAVDEFAPELLMFGSNCGGTGYAFDLRSDEMPIVAIEQAALDISEAVPMGRTLYEFFETLLKM